MYPGLFILGDLQSESLETNVQGSLNKVTWSVWEEVGGDVGRRLGIHKFLVLTTKSLIGE